MDTLISNATIVTMNEQMTVLLGGYLGVTDGKISYLAKVPPKEQPVSIVDGTGMVVLPGLVNCHTHLATSVLRSFLDDLSGADALEAQLQKEDRMDSRCAKAAAKLAIAECLRFGVTSVSDLYYYPNATAEAVAETGIKANLALSSYRFIDPCEDFDFETDEQCQELCRVVEKWNGYDAGRIKIDAGIYAEYTSNYKLWEALGSYAAQEGLRMQLHLSQTQEEVESCLERSGMEPGALLACHRLFSVPATVAGGNCLTELERKLLAGKKASVVACPMADAKLGRPGTPILDTVRSGLNVALGTGGARESGNLDLFEVMRSAAGSARSTAGDPAAFPAQAALMLATVCGARAQGREASCGMLKEGMEADLVLVDFTAPHLMPCHNVMNGLVFSAKGGDVAMTMVRGKILYQSGRFPTINLQEVVQELTDYAIPHLFDESKE